jgi:hypothetical protein
MHPSASAAGIDLGLARFTTPGGVYRGFQEKGYDQTGIGNK